MLAESVQSIDVVIITRDRLTSLRAALVSLLEAATQVDGKLQIYLFVNGLSLDKNIFEGLKASLAAQTPSHTKLTIEYSRTSLTPAAARNRAVKLGTSPWVYFADDDVVFPDSLLRQFVELAGANTTVDVFGGPNLTPLDSNFLQISSGLALQSWFGSYRCRMRYVGEAPKDDCDDAYLILCNLFVRRQWVERFPFPEDAVCAEENLALSVWRNNGALTAFRPSLSVYHERRRNFVGFAKQIFKYGRGRGHLVTLGYLRPFHLVPSFSLLLLLALPFVPAGRTVILPPVLLVYFALNSFNFLYLLKSNSFMTSALAFFLVPVIHLCYGLGLLQGTWFFLQKRRIKNRTEINTD